MNYSEKIKSNTLPVKSYAWVLTMLWAVVGTISLVWNVLQIKNESLETARIQARIAYKKDVIYRHWNAESAFLSP